jgi:hypothetical protein
MGFHLLRLHDFIDEIGETETKDVTISDADW